ncbi:hypothetical protein [Rhizobium leguminosarum]|uniref:hypothetical protein n=1 Tax=Rhizobium leguminosarum TaxID=384 RepID=UPI0015BA6669|nr:hypothetical protein [Rhizobium leguminosarum]
MKLKKNAEEAAEGGCNFAGLSEHSWNGRNVRPRQMCFGEETSLGIVGGTPTAPRVRFALKEKPFSGDIWFHQQHLVASISTKGLWGEEANHTFNPPCIPELNEVASRVMHRNLMSVRLEPAGVGLIINATEKDVDLGAFPTSTLMESVFNLGGYSAQSSASGLITRQLITRMGGVDGARAFKIPGVRKLLKTYGPLSSFSRRGALGIIGQADLATGSFFEDHRNLYIEPRKYGDGLTPSMVFSHLVEKGLFRIGVDLRCPACALTSWTALDVLHQKLTCSLCGTEFDATRQLVEGNYAYRRNGVLGLEKNTQGAIPVVLLLQQLFVNLDIRIFSSSYDLDPNEPGSGLPTCESDFCILASEDANKTAVIIGECKDAGGTIDENDINNLRRVAEALPDKRFQVYILLAKLAPFTTNEIALAKELNSTPWIRRVIMLTARELEPYHMFERTNKELGLEIEHCFTFKDLAEATQLIYFDNDRANTK